MKNTAALILAAGESRRFGSPKLLARYRGRPLLCHGIETARTVLPDRVYVVLGANREALARHAAGARVVVNRDWQRGLASSISAGIEALPDDIDHVLLLLADQVGIGAYHLRLLLEAHGEWGRITCARYGAVLGVPAVFSREWFSTLRSLEGDRGARYLLRRHREGVAAIDLPAAAIDIDTVEEWRRLFAGKE
jgi:molybdenum cofactor cytidylyltransferase